MAWPRVSRLRLVPAGCERLEHDLGRLRARDSVASVDDEKRYAGDAQLHCLALICPDLVRKRAGIQCLSSAFPIDADLPGQLDQCVTVANQPPFHEIRGHQALLHLSLEAESPSQVDEPVRVKSVGAFGDVVAILEAFAGRRVYDPRMHGVRLLEADAVLAGQRLLEVAFRVGPGVGIELEAAELHSDIGPVLEPLQSGLKPAFADVAPGSNDVGP